MSKLSYEDKIDIYYKKMDNQENQLLTNIKYEIVL